MEVVHIIHQRPSTGLSKLATQVCSLPPVLRPTSLIYPRRPTASAAMAAKAAMPPYPGARPDDLATVPEDAHGYWWFWSLLRLEERFFIDHDDVPQGCASPLSERLLAISDAGTKKGKNGTTSFGNPAQTILVVNALASNAGALIRLIWTRGGPARRPRRRLRQDRFAHCVVQKQCATPWRSGQASSRFPLLTSLSAHIDRNPFFPHESVLPPRRCIASGTLSGAYITVSAGPTPGPVPNFPDACCACPDFAAGGRSFPGYGSVFPPRLSGSHSPCSLSALRRFYLHPREQVSSQRRLHTDPADLSPLRP